MGHVRDRDEFDDCCRVCSRRFESLSFEHVPPRSAGNTGGAEIFDLFQALNRFDGVSPGRGKIMQRGTGAYSLCRRCNERAGHNYVPEYSKWVNGCWRIVDELDLEAIDAAVEPHFVRLTSGEKTQPGRLMKQLVTMFLALSSGAFATDRRHIDLVEYAQDPEARGLSSRYQFYAVLMTGNHVRLNPGCAALDFKTGESTFAMEIAHPPLAFVMSIDETSSPVRSSNISCLADVGIEQTADVTLDVLVGFGHSPIPFDFRSQAAMDAGIAESRRKSAARRLWTPDGDLVDELARASRPRPVLLHPGGDHRIAC